jgi:sulfonate transport system permease protein
VTTTTLVAEELGAPRASIEVAPQESSPDALAEARDHAVRRVGRASRLPRPIRRLAGPVLLVVLWQLLHTFGIVDTRTLAPPSAVVSAGWELVQTGELQQHLWVSLRRATIGLSLGVTSGVALATLAGLFRRGEDLLDPVMQILRAVPVLGLLPLVIIWFGIGEAPKIALVAVGTAFPVYLNTYAGIRNVDARIVETATSFGVSRWGLVRDVVLPGAVPGFLVGLRYALTGAWLLMIVAEQINAKSGIGYLMNEARAWFRTDIIVLGLAIYGALGLLTDGIVRLLEHTMLGWRRGFSGT